MKRFTIPALLTLSAWGAVCVAQFPVPTEVDQRVSPVYPRKQPYAFRSTGPNYDPFQFNWYTGRWDYVPIPYDEVPGIAGTPYQYNSFTGRWDYVPQQTVAQARRRIGDRLGSRWELDGHYSRLRAASPAPGK